MKWTNKELATLRRLWKGKSKIREIAEELKRSQPSVVSKVSDLQAQGILAYRHRDARMRHAQKSASKEVLAIMKEEDAKLSSKTVRQIPRKSKFKIASVTPGPKLSEKKEWKALMNVVFASTEVKIAKECDMLKSFLIQKNHAYGDSALTPIRIFSTSDASEQLKVRIDDKLNRLMQGDDSIEADEDVIKDLIGYLVLLLIQMKET